MRRPWIKIETTTPDKPEICAIATTLRMDEDTVLGKLVRLWSWVEVNKVSSNDLGVTKEFLDKLVGRKGFVAAMKAAGWIAETDGKLSLPKLERHNGGLAKVRALTAQRVAVHRLKKQMKGQVNVSEALHSEVAVAPVSAPEPVISDTAEKGPSVVEELEVSEQEAAAEVSVIDDTPGPVPDEETPDEVAEISPVEATEGSPTEVPEISPVEAAESSPAEPEVEVAADEGKRARKRRARQEAEASEQPLLF